jgi:hypothetical protein
MTVGQLAAGLGIGAVFGIAAYATLRNVSTENPAIGAMSMLGGAGAVAWGGVFLPSAAVKIAVVGAGLGAFFGGALGVRDAVQGAVDEYAGYPQAA